MVVLNPRVFVSLQWKTCQPDLSIYHLRERILTSGRIGESSALTAEQQS